MSSETIKSIGSDHVVYKGPSVDGLITYDSGSTVIKKIYDEILKVEKRITSNQKELYSRSAYVGVYRGFRPDADIELGSGPKYVYYNVMRFGKSDKPCSVQWVVSGYGSQPASGIDFVGGVFPAGLVSFAAWETIKTISFSVIDDGLTDGTEQFKVDIINPANCIIHTATAIGTIYKDAST